MATDNPWADRMSVAELARQAWNFSRYLDRAQHEPLNKDLTRAALYEAIGDKQVASVFAVGAAVQGAATPEAAITACLAL